MSSGLDLPEIDLLPPEQTTTESNEESNVQLGPECDPEDNQRGAHFGEDPNDAIGTDDVYEFRRVAHYCTFKVNGEEYGCSFDWQNDILNATITFLTPMNLPSDIKLKLKTARRLDADDNPDNRSLHTTFFDLPGSEITDLRQETVVSDQLPQVVKENTDLSQKGVKLFKVSFKTTCFFVSSGGKVPTLANENNIFTKNIQSLIDKSVGISADSPASFEIFIMTWGNAFEIDFNDFEQRIAEEKTNPALKIFFKETPNTGRFNRGNFTKFAERPPLKVQPAKLAFQNSKVYKFYQAYAAIYEQGFVDAVDKEITREPMSAKFIEAPGCRLSEDSECSRYIVAVVWDKVDLVKPHPNDRFEMRLPRQDLLENKPEQATCESQPEQGDWNAEKDTKSEGVFDATPLASPAADSLPLEGQSSGVVDGGSDNEDDDSYHGEPDGDTNDLSDVMYDSDMADSGRKSRRKKKNKKSKVSDEHSIYSQEIWSATCLPSPVTYYKEGLVWFAVDRPRVPLPDDVPRNTPREFSKLKVPSMTIKFDSMEAFDSALSASTAVEISMSRESNHQTLNDELRALDTLLTTAATNVKKTEFVKFWMGQPQPPTQTSVNLLDECGERNFHKDFSDSQRKARDAFKNIRYQIMATIGPYGAGKTELIRRMIAEFLTKIREPGKQFRILVVCPSNKQVDDTATKIEDFNQSENLGITVTRVHNIKGEKKMVVTHFKSGDKPASTKRFHEQECTALETEFLALNEFSQMSRDYADKRKAGDPRRVLENLALSKRMLERLEKEAPNNKVYATMSTLLERHSGFDKIKAPQGKLSPEESSQIMDGITRLQNDTIHATDVLCCTINNASKVNLYENFNADLVIIDEACRASELSFLIIPAFYHGIYWILGDPNQMGPVVLSAGREKDAPPKQYINPLQNQRLLSAMERYIRNGHDSVLLTEQFRCRTDVADFASNEFYHGKIKLAPGVEDLYTTTLRKITKQWGFNGDSSMIVINPVDSRSCKETNGTSTFNEDHVRLSEAKIKDIFADESFKGGITVISMYKAQDLLYKQMIAKNNWGSRVQSRTAADDSQGHEDDVVIVDLVRSFGLGFTGEPHRFNVVMTRTKYLLIVLCNSDMLMKKDNMGESKLIERASRKPESRHIYDLLEYAKRNDAIRELAAREPLTCNGCGLPGHKQHECPQEICTNCGQKGHQHNKKHHPCENDKVDQCFKCGEFGHTMTGCTSTAPYCHSCRTHDHDASDCEKAIARRLARTVCHNCDERGHKATACPQPKRPSCKHCPGSHDHFTYACPKQTCSNCLQKGHISRNCKVPVTRELLYMQRNAKLGKVIESDGNEGFGVPAWETSENSANQTTDAVPAVEASQNSANQTTDAVPAWGASQNSANQTTDAVPAWGASHNSANQNTAAVPAWGASHNSANQNTAAVPAWGASHNSAIQSTGAFPAWGASHNSANQNTAAFPAWGASHNSANQNTGAFPIMGAYQNTANQNMGAFPIMGAYQNSANQNMGAFPAWGASTTRTNFGETGFGSRSAANVNQIKDWQGANWAETANPTPIATNTANEHRWQTPLAPRSVPSHLVESLQLPAANNTSGGSANTGATDRGGNWYSASNPSGGGSYGGGSYGGAGGGYGW